MTDSLAGRVAPDSAPGIACRLFGPLSTSLGASGLIQALNVVTGIALARGLGPTGRGEVAAIVLWPAVLVSLGQVGISDAITYHVARRLTEARTVLATSMMLLTLQTVVLAGAGFVVLPHVLSGHTEFQAGLLYLLYVPLFLLVDYPLRILQGQGRFASFNAVRLGLIAWTAVLLVALSSAHALNVWTATATYLSGYVVLVAPTIATALRGSTGSYTPQLRLARHLFAFGARSHVGFVSSLLNERLDQLAISILLAPAKLGLYVVAATLTSGATLVGAAVGLVALPSIARLESKAVRAASAARYVQLSFLSAVVFAAPAVVLAPQLLRIFFGDGYTSAANVSRVLLVAAVPLSLSRLLSALLKGDGRPLTAGVGDMTALGVTAVGLGIGVPLFGIMGAAIVSLLAYSVSSVWMLVRVCRALDIGAVQLLVPRAPSSWRWRLEGP